MKGMRLGREKSGSSVGKKAPKPDKLYKQKNKAEKSTGLDSNEVAMQAPRFVDAKCDVCDLNLPHLKSKLLGCGITFYLSNSEAGNLDLLDSPNTWGIVTTIAPRRSNKLDESEHESLLNSVEGKPGVCAVLTGVQYGKPPFGESKPCCFSDEQKMAFGVHCRFAMRNNLPLIITLSPDVKDEKENAHAVQDLKSWLQEFNVPKEHKIYFSSWTGPVVVLLALLKLYPNSVVGLNGAVAFRSNDHLREAAFDIPLTRMVLESDAPNNPPSELLLPHSPWTVLVVAQCVCTQKKLADIGEVLTQTNQNTATFFNKSLLLLEQEQEEEQQQQQQTEEDLQELTKFLE